AHAGLNLLAGGWRPFSPLAPAVQAIVLGLLWVAPRLAWRRFSSRGGTLALASPERLQAAGAGGARDHVLRAASGQPRGGRAGGWSGWGGWASTNAVGAG